MLSKVLGFIAITAVVTNIVSGFLITDRMLKMFKRPRGEEVMAHLVQYIYIVSAALFILSLKWMNSPGHGAARCVCGRDRYAVGHHRHAACAASNVFNWEWVSPRHPDRHGHRDSHRLHHADDGGAATDCAVPRLRRAGGGAGGHGRISIATPHDPGSPWWRWSSRRCSAFSPSPAA